MEIIAVILSTFPEQQHLSAFLFFGPRFAQSSLFLPCADEHVPQAVPLGIPDVWFRQKPPDSRRKILPLFSRPVPERLEVIVRMAELLADFCEIGRGPEQHFQCAAGDGGNVAGISTRRDAETARQDVGQPAENHAQNRLRRAPSGLHLLETILHLISPLNFTFYLSDCAGHFHPCKVQSRRQFPAGSFDVAGWRPLDFEVGKAVQQRQDIQDAGDMDGDARIQLGRRVRRGWRLRGSLALEVGNRHPPQFHRSRQAPAIEHVRRFCRWQRRTADEEK